MDLALHLRVLSRHRTVLVTGLTAAVLLAALSFVKVGPDGISYRQAEKWQSVTRLSAARGGNPFKPTGGTDDGSYVDPTTFAVVTSQYANNEEVKRLLRRTGPVKGEISATTATTESGTFLPFIDVSAIATTPASARVLANRAAKAISQFVERQQVASGVRSNRRIILGVASRSEEPELVQGRKKGTPMFVFLAIASLTIGGIYLRENIRRSTQGLTVEELTPVQTDRAASEDERAVPHPVAFSERRPKRKVEDGVRRPSTLFVDSPADARSRSRGDALPRVDEG